MCAILKVVYHIEIIEGEDHPQGMGRKEFYEKGETAGLTVWMKNPIWGAEKVVIMSRGFYVMEGLILIREKGVLGLILIDKHRYWPKARRLRRLFIPCSAERLATRMQLHIAFRGRSTILCLSRILTTSY